MIRARAGVARIATLAGLATLCRPALADDAPGAPPDRLGGAVHLDDRAPAFAAIKPVDLADGFALMDLLGGVFPDIVRMFGRLRDGLGLYAFTGGELSENGIAPDALVLASLGVADTGDAVINKKTGARRIVVRHRFVVRVVDAEKFVRAATAVLASNSTGMVAIGGARAAGAPPKWASEVKGLAAKHKVRLVARLRDGAVVAIRPVGDFALIDYADPWGTGPPDPKLKLGRLLQKMIAAPKQPLSQSLRQGARPLLAEEDASIALIIEPGAMGPLFPRPSCSKDWTDNEGALIDDAAVLLRLHPFQWRLGLAFSLSTAGRARLGTAANDDGLLDTRTAAADGIAAAALTVGSLEVFRAAPRPQLFAAGLPRAYQSLDSCGPLAAVALGARFWPQLLALEVESRMTRLGAGALLPSLRNVAGVLREIPGAKQRWEALTVLFASVPSSAGETLSNLLSKQSGGRSEQQRFGERQPTFFDLPAATGFSEAGVERIAGHHDAVAFTPQASGLGWYYRMVRRPARFGPQSRLGSLYLNLAAVLENLAESADPGTRAAVRLAATQLGQLGGHLTLDAQTNLLRLELNLSGNQ